MSQTGEHPAVPDKKEAPSPAEVIWAAARWVVGQEWLMRLASVATLIAIGAAGIVYGEDKFDGGLAKGVAPIIERVVKTEADVAALQKNQADMQRMTLETNATVKMIAYRLGVVPLSLTDAKDGGQ